MNLPFPSPPLRILQLNSLLTGGGTDDQCLKLAAGLGRLGQEVWIAGPTGRELSTTAGRCGVPFHPTPREGPLKLAFILAAARLIRSHRIQIVHGHHGRDLWPTILAARLSGVRPRVVLTRHLAKSPSSWFSRRFLLNRCDALIAVSAFVATVLREGVYEPDSPVEERRSRPPIRGDFSRLRVIHGGIDVERFAPHDATAQRRAWGLEPHHVAFGVVGGYDKPRGKGQREFLRAAAQVAVPDARFLVIGRGTLAGQLQADLAGLGLAGRAQLTPWSHDMPAAMNALDCLVHPQVATEASPMVLLEAMSCGKPVIASRLDGIPESFIDGEQGLLVPPEDVPALAGALTAVAGDPVLRARLSRSGRDHVVRHFTLDRLARDVLALYRELVSA